MSASGSDDMEVDEQDREQVDSEREKSGGEREKRKTKRKQATHVQTCDIMDDMQME